MMPQVKEQAPPSAYVTPDMMEGVIVELVAEAVDYFNNLLTDFFPNGAQHGLRKQKASDRLRSFLERTLAEDVPYLEDPKYLEKFRTGVYPPLGSPYWVALSAVPIFFNQERKDFIELYRKEIVDFEARE